MLSLGQDVMISRIRREKPELSAVRWLILFALAWSQFVFAAHHADHHATDASETCAVCLQFERNDDAVTDVNHVTAASSFHAITPALSARNTDHKTYSLFRARASP